MEGLFNMLETKKKKAASKVVVNVQTKKTINSTNQTETPPFIKDMMGVITSDQKFLFVGLSEASITKGAGELLNGNRPKGVTEGDLNFTAVFHSKEEIGRSTKITPLIPGNSISWATQEHVKAIETLRHEANLNRTNLSEFFKDKKIKFIE
jgi:hypothetical protein